MARTYMDIAELVRIEYEVHYDEEELERRGFDTLEAYIGNQNPWLLMDTEDVITGIEHNQILDYIESNFNSITTTE